MLRQMKLGYKLIGAFLIMAAVVAVTGIFGIWNIHRVGSEVASLMKVRAAQEKVVLLLEQNQKACRVNLVEGALVRCEPAEFERYVENYRKKCDLFHSYCNILLNGDRKMGLPPAAKGSKLEEYTKSILASWGEFEGVAEELIAHKKSLLGGLRPGVVDQVAKDRLADAKLNELARVQIMEASENAKLDIDDLADLVESQMVKSVKDAARIERSSTIGFLVSIMLAALLAVVMGIIGGRNIVQRLGDVGKALKQGAGGDLAVSVQVDDRDEIGVLANDFNVMAEKLSELVEKVNRSGTELTSASSTIYEVSKKVVNAAELQFAGVHDTSSAVLEINASVNQVAQGVEILAQSASESSSSILEMASSVEEVALNMDTLGQAVDEVSSSIAEMAASIRQIGASIQALQESSSTTASSVAEMDSSIRQVERNASSTAAISVEVLKDAEEGNAAVAATIAGINDIRRQSQVTSEVIATLSSRTQDIGSILSVIDEVTEQTNLLALNAAIIAAQAGDHGKGFAVVADEIKELADRTQSSTREIANVIKAVQEETRRAVEAIRLAEKSIDGGVMLSRKSGEALGKIVEGVKKANSQVNEIARATVEQAKGSQMIREAMEQVSEMVAQIAGATQEQTKGSELIMGAAERMRDLTSQVRSTTAEQSKVGAFIAKSTESITGMISQIKRACDEQMKGGRQIVQAVERIQGSADSSLEVARVLDDTVARLSHHTGIMLQEMGNFKTRHATGGAYGENLPQV